MRHYSSGDSMKKMSLKVLQVLYISSLFLNPLFAGPAERPAPLKISGPISHQELADIYMRAFGINEDANNEDVKPVENKKVNLEVPQLDRQEKLLKLFELYAENEGKISRPAMLMDSSVRILIKDLDLFYGQGEDYQQHLFGRFNRTQTVFGEVALAKMLVNFETDVRELKARQAFIKELLANQQLFQELENLVAAVKTCESEIFSFTVQENKPTKELINRLYFNSQATKGLNANPVALEVATRLGNVASGTVVALPVLVPAAIAFLFIKSNMNRAEGAPANPIIGNDNVDFFNRFMTGYFDPRRYINDIDVDPLDGHLRQFNMNLGTKGGVIAYGCVHGMPLYIAKNGYDRAVQLNNAANYLQARLMGVATLVDSLKHIQEIIAANSIVSEGLTTRSNVQALFDSSSTHSQEFNQLVELLQTTTFQGDEASFFSLTGRVLAAHTLMNKVKGEFMGAFEALGEVDACLSIAKLYREYDAQRVGYTFVNYEESATPHVHLKDFWNPMIDPKVVVTNNLEMGAQGITRDIILTGANTGGKSTILKAIIINLLCAQTLTIAPARSITLTPFYYLGSSLNIADDTAAGYSLYQAEVNRAQSLLQASLSLKGNNFGFMVIDELFRGTSPDQAEKGSYECAKQLLTHDNTMFILATHFTKHSTKLEQETQGMCKNYKVEISKDVNGALVRPFKLEPGINSTHVAEDILHTAMSSVSAVAA